MTPEILNNTQAILFDLDGVIIDSEELHCAAWYAVAQKYGVKSFAYDAYSQEFLGVADAVLAEEIFKDIEIPTWQVVEEKIDYFLDHAGKIKVSDDIYDFIKKYTTKFQIGVVTNCSHKECKTILKAIGLREYVHFYVTHENVKKPKPDPAIYALAFEKLKENNENLSPEEVLVIEDSDTGVSAASAAGFPNILQRHFEDPDIVGTLDQLANR